MEYREMNPDELVRIGEVNREEVVKGIYKPEPDESGLGIIAHYKKLEKPVNLNHWGEAGTESRIKSWKPALDNGGAMYGAFEGDTFAGFIILGPPQNDASAEVVALFIDRDFRYQGVGSKLMQWAEVKCKEMNVKAMYVYSNPTVSSANFYMKSGFQISGLVSKHIVKSLPGDLVLAKKI